jgi:UMF1 family MFS transporter
MHMEKKDRKKTALSVPERAWILYDVANSSFILILVTTVMPIFFKDVAAKGIPASLSTAHWGFAVSLSSLVVAVLAPVLGVLADYRRMKKRFFNGFLAVGIGLTLLLTLVREGDWFMCLFLFVVAKTAYSGANLFYDAFLVDVTTRPRMDRISSAGYAWGYIGGTVPFLAVIGIIFATLPAGTPASVSSFSVKAAFLITAFWWGIFSIPMLKQVHQVHYLPPSPSPVREGFRRLFTTVKEIRKYKNAFLFLGAYFFYIDGVGTIITMAAAYGRDIGLGVATLILAILMIQLVAFPFALLYGHLAGRFSTKALLFVGIFVYMVITLLSFFLPVMPTPGSRAAMFWILAFMVASSQGGIQALSRSFFGKLIPAHRSAEFFGFYNVFGKFATIAGPFLMGMVSRYTGHSRYGALSLLILFGIGALVLARVKSAGSDEALS